MPTSAATATAAALPLPIGVGIDTARYGHYAAFLRPDLQPAAAELEFTESAAGYDKLRQRLRDLCTRHGAVHFHIRLDAAGQYAENLLAFLHTLATPPADTAAPSGTDIPMSAKCNAAFTISCGDTQSNKNYRAALFGHKKSDPVEARAVARFALTEHPKPMRPLPRQFHLLRQIAGRLHAVVRQRTRLVSQLHHLLARAFPELATLVNDLTVGWVLELLQRFPTAANLAAASKDELEAVPYLPHERCARLLEQARASVGSLAGTLEEELVRDQVRQLRDANARQKRLENLLTEAYRELPTSNHLDTIKGFGEVTAAVLTAFILDIDRFATPGELVGYFGTFPIEVSSGFERDGTRRAPQRRVMCPRGNDLVRRYLWMAALSAVQHNPAVKPLYQRVRAKHPEQAAIAIGHAMRKLLHLAFAVWKSGQPFDAAHYAWGQPNHVPVEASDTTVSPAASDITVSPAASNINGLATVRPSEPGAGARSVNEQAAGHKPEAMPAQSVVTAARPETVAESPAPVESAAATSPADKPLSTAPATPWVDFAHVKKQLPMARVLDQLGLTARLRGSGAQQRCTCPIHRGDGRGRTFSVNLQDNVYQCFDAQCASHGDVIELWAAVHKLSLRAAALDLIQTFNLEPAPPQRSATEKRNG